MATRHADAEKSPAAQMIDLLCMGQDAADLARVKEAANPWLKVDQVAELAGVSVRTIWRWVKAKKFPRPIRRVDPVSLKGRWSRWRQATVLAAISATTAAEAQGPEASDE